ncbi:response regulator [Sediminimonas sp.]|uniref:sigma-54-dependent transcriptional regulator n=1 Tax=Sediminimonas sp. TaxID=2823379 RepID=UPI0025EEC81C|nr:response regulator [Sediminimonas sp.]
MFRGARIVLVEDDHIMGESITQRLELEGAEVTWVKQAVRAIHAIRSPRARVHAVVCDIRLPDGTGEEIFTTLCQTMTPPPFLFITGHGGIDQAVRLMQAGAADYVTKPFEMGAFLDRLRRLVDSRDDEGQATPFGTSAAAMKLDAQAAQAARSSLPVLVRGAPGTGKTRVARRVHMLSDRSAAPVIEVDLARDPSARETLFGADGALTRVGEGTVVLIAVERLDPAEQDALTARLDAGFAGRIVSTMGPGTGHQAAGRAFRRDLLSRLAGVEIPVPPLRERPEDAVWLLGEMFRRFAGRWSTRPLKGLSSLAEDAARAHDWPDNGREVRSRLVGALQLAEGEWIQPADLFPEQQAAGRFPTLAEAREATERRQIIAALDLAGGHVTEAAKLLRVSRTTLWEKMHKLGL